MGLLQWLRERADRKRDEKDPVGAPFRQEIRAKEAWFVEQVNKRGPAWWNDPLLGAARYEWWRSLMPREELEAIVAAIDAYEREAPKRAAEFKRLVNEAKAKILRDPAD